MMKGILMCLTILSSTLANANPTKKAASAHVVQAKQALASARKELKASKAKERAEKRAKSKARTVARAKARLAKAQAADRELGCGTCVDTHDGSCTCPPAISEDSEPAGEPTFNQPTERDCRRMAVAGETWEDACERVLGIPTTSWDVQGRLVTTDPPSY